MRKCGSVLVLIAALLGCDDDDEDNEIVEVQAWEAAIIGTNGNEILQGESEAVQVPGNDEFTTSINLRNDAPGSVRPWHVHFGTCGSGGDIVGADGDYPRLVIEDDGSASATVTIEETLDPRDAYHVNVHNSDDDLDTIIACGNLTPAVLDLDAGVASDAGPVADAANPDAAAASDAAIGRDAAVPLDATVSLDAAPGTTTYP